MALLQAGAGALAIAIEQVYDMPQLTVEHEAQLSKLIAETGNTIEVSAHLFRLTFQDKLVNAVASIALDNASVNMPAPGSIDFQQGTLAPISWAVPIGWTKLAELTQKSSLSVKQYVTLQMTQATLSLTRFRDSMLAAGDGTGFCGNVVAIDPVNKILTFNRNDYGATIVGNMQSFDLYNGLVLIGTCQVLSANTGIGAAETVYVDQVPAAAVVGSVARVPQLTSGSPVFTYGIPYWLSTATVGLTAGIDRSVPANNYIIANGVNAANSSVTLPMFRLAQNQIRGALGMDALTGGKLVLHTHPGQWATYEAIGGQLQTVPLNNGQASKFDGLFDMEGLSVGGMKIIQNIHAHRQRWDFLNVARWGRIMWGKSPFWYDSDGKKVFETYGTNGNITTGMTSYLVDTLQLFVDNSKTQTTIFNAKQMSGY